MIQQWKSMICNIWTLACTHLCNQEGHHQAQLVRFDMLLLYLPCWCSLQDSSVSELCRVQPVVLVLLRRCSMLSLHRQWCSQLKSMNSLNRFYHCLFNVLQISYVSSFSDDQIVHPSCRKQRLVWNVVEQYKKNLPSRSTS